jgi:hypothetical protein
LGTSSGLIVSTPAGSTGWLSSICHMSVICLRKKTQRPKLKDNELLFAVREPFQSVRTQIGISGIIKLKIV